jgi:hypothetical protein
MHAEQSLDDELSRIQLELEDLTTTMMFQQA